MTKFSTIATGLAVTIATIGGVRVQGASHGVTALASRTNTPAVSVATEPTVSARPTRSAAPRASADPTVTVTGADADDRQRLAKALQRYHDNALDLPDLEVRFFDDDRECGGHDGLFQASHTPWRILICSDLEYVPTHELAHAWEAATLDDDARERYVTARGLASWDDPGLSWMERGVEDAAFNMQQNLMATNPPLASNTWQDRTAAYRILTGDRSPLLP